MNRILNYILNIQTAFAQPFATTSGSSGNAANSAAEATGNQVTNLVTSIFSSIPYWITGFIVIVLTFFVARIVKSAVENRMIAAGMEEEHQEIQLVATRGASATVLLIGITAGLKIAGLDLTSIIAAAAFGVGFAMKDLIMNFISGIIILLQKQFTIGDWIKISGTMGIIKEIQSRYTIIKKFDGTKVIVPNSELFKKQVVNLTGNGTRRFTLDLNIDLYMDLKQVIDVVYESIGKVDKILKFPKPNIIVLQPGPAQNKLRLRCWVEAKKGVLKPTSALVRQLHKDFYSRGWSWVMPTQKIVLDKDVHPDITERAESYIESHKRAAKAPTLIEQQKQKMVQQEEQDKKAAEAQAEQSSTPLPQAEQIGVGGPSKEVPVWLQQVAEMTSAPTQPTSDQQVQQAETSPAQLQAQTVRPQQPEQNPAPVVQAPPVVQEAQQPLPPNESLPVIIAPDVQPNQAPGSNIAPPIVAAPDVQPQVAVTGGQQPPQN